MSKWTKESLIQPYFLILKSLGLHSTAESGSSDVNSAPVACFIVSYRPVCHEKLQIQTVPRPAKAPVAVDLPALSSSDP